MMFRGMKNKRGVVDQIMTSVIVLFGVFFLMGIFVTVSSNIGKIVGHGGNTPSVYAGSSALLEEVNYKGEEVFVVDAVQEIFRSKVVISGDKGREVKNSLEESLKELVSEQDSCLGLVWGDGEEPLSSALDRHEIIGFYNHNLILLEYEEGNVVRSHILAAGYEPEGAYRCLEVKYAPIKEWSKASFEIDGRTIYLQSFYGRCRIEGRCK